MTPPSITGKSASGENSPLDLGTPLAALTSFYSAFNNRDLAQMEAVWLPGDEPSMDNPIGGIRRGWSEIRAGYAKLFSGPAQVYVEFYDYSLQVEGACAIAVGRERGWCQTPAGRIQLAIRTSRVFVRTAQGSQAQCWRQIHHHGSVEFPALLAEYQKLILGAALEAPAA